MGKGKQRRSNAESRNIKIALPFDKAVEALLSVNLKRKTTKKRKTK